MKRVRWFAVSCHLIFIILMLFGSAVTEKKKRKALIVKTISFKPPTQAREAVVVSAPQKKQTAPSATAPVKKTSPPKPAPKKETPVRKAPPEKKIAPRAQPSQERKVTDAGSDVSKKLIQELEEKLSKIETQKNKRSSQQAEIVTVQPLSLQIDASDTMDVGYVDLMVSYLHEKLQLPEEGAVKIQLTLLPDGSIVKLIVLQAQSKKNKAYLEEKLALLHFPPLEGKESQTFTLNFCNAR